MEYLKIILSSLKEFITNPLLYWIVILLSALLLFLPASFLKVIRLDDFSVKHAEIIGLVFLTFSIVVGLNLLIAFYKWVEKRYKRKRLKTVRENELLRSYPAEKKIIVEMFQAANRSKVLFHNSGSVVILLNKKIIQRTSNMVNIIEGEPYFLQPWVCDFLNKHHDTLKQWKDELRRVYPNR